MKFAAANCDQGVHAAANRDCRGFERVFGDENADFIFQRIRDQ